MTQHDRYKLLFGIIALAAMVPMGCGGGSFAPSQNTQVITAAQVFSNQAETWTFRNGYGDLTVIDVMPQADGSTVWHYTKSADRAYWSPGVPKAELYFNLAKDANGQWYSTGGHIIFPLGCPWCSPVNAPFDMAYTVVTDPGKPRAYLILGDSGTGVDTTFPDPNPGTRWKTSMYVENGELISEQWEGPCTHEKWHFAAGRGLVKVEPLDKGDCLGFDPLLTMTR